MGVYLPGIIVVQDKTLHTLARVELLWRDRWHGQLRATPQVYFVFQYCRVVVCQYFSMVVR